jgi:3-carboxy-cis,cis-muconate cycloisomerase/3-oxoadipate enol-lactonase
VKVKPSSSTSEPAEGGLFDAVLARGRVRAEVSDRAWLQAMLDVEAALARAEARAGVISSEDAEAIGRACRAENFDIAAIGSAAADGGNPVIPLVKALTAAVQGDAARQVHRGATSQDVSDTAAMLVAQRALAPLMEDLDGVSEAAMGLAGRHCETLMVGRTLLQHALPTTFGLKAAGWSSGLDQATVRLDEVRTTRLAVQLGGAVGTLASLGDRGSVVLAYMADGLGLAKPDLPWHTERTRIGDLAGALGTVAGAIAKVAGDVVLLAQTEVGEVREGVAGRGGSSTLPQKRNPIAAVLARAGADQAPGLVATLLASMAQEHERAAGAWHAEWQPFTALLRCTGSAAAWLRDCLEHLEVDADRMRANLDLTGGLVLAERVTTALTPHLGRMAAHEIVEEAAGEVAGGRAFADALAARPEVTKHLSSEDIADLLDPSQYIGRAQLLTLGVLKDHHVNRVMWQRTSVPVHFVDEGPRDAPVLVLSGSLGSTLDMWEPQMGALSSRFRVIRYDHRGHGASPLPPAPYSIEGLGADLVALLDRLDIERAHVCGASMGGEVAMWMGAFKRDRVDRLILCCSSPWFGPPDPWLERAETVRRQGTGAVADAVVGRWFTPAFAAAQPALVARMREMIAATPPEGYAACCEAVGRTDLRPFLKGIEAPTLVIAGAQDPAVPGERTQDLADGIPNCRIEILDPAAHLASVEQADRVTELILEHLTSPPT